MMTEDVTDTKNTASPKDMETTAAPLNVKWQTNDNAPSYCLNENKCGPDQKYLEKTNEGPLETRVFAVPTDNSWLCAFSCNLNLLLIWKGEWMGDSRSKEISVKALII